MSVMVAAGVSRPLATGAWGVRRRSEMGMQTWVITDMDRQLIFGVAEAQTQSEAVLLAAARRADWFWKAKPGLKQGLSIQLQGALTDGRWREAAPGRPLPAADSGGDHQASQALERCWWLALPDGDWALFRAAWYVTDDSWDQSVVRSQGRQLERQEQYLICSDIRDPSGSEIWSDIRCVTELTWEATEANVEVAARDFDPVAEIKWAGGPF